MSSSLTFYRLHPHYRWPLWTHRRYPCLVLLIKYDTLFPSPCAWPLFPSFSWFIKVAMKEKNGGISKSYKISRNLATVVVVAAGALSNSSMRTEFWERGREEKLLLLLWVVARELIGWPNGTKVYNALRWVQLCLQIIPFDVAYIKTYGVLYVGRFW